jgi:hypothetical protein
VQNSAASAGTISLASVSKTSVQPKFDFQLTSCQIGTFAASSKSPSYERVRFFTQNAKPFSVSAFPVKVYKVPVLLSVLSFLFISSLFLFRFLFRFLFLFLFVFFSFSFFFLFSFFLFSFTFFFFSFLFFSFLFFYFFPAECCTRQSLPLPLGWWVI